MLAAAIAELEPQARFEGSGDARMAAAGIRLRARTGGLAVIGPLAALPLMPRYIAMMLKVLWLLRRDPPDVLVLIDFGAFHLRLARLLRFIGYRGPILYAFPPGAWLHRPKTAKKVAGACEVIVPFEGQAQAYARTGLACHALGHPLAAAIAARPPRPAAPADGGVVALLPGSRRQELQHMLPPMIAAIDIIRRTRPEATARIVLSDPRYVDFAQTLVAGRPGFSITVEGRTALHDVDAALVKSGTIVLECALLEVPTAAMYIVSPQLAWVVRNVFKFRSGFVTLPNLIAGREIVRERLQEAAVPSALAADLDELLAWPGRQLEGYREVRTALGDDRVLTRWAELAVRLARAGSQREEPVRA